MSETARQRAIGILGMHRSGTSAIARAVNLLGVSLGPPESLMEPRPDNPEGFWENQAVYDFHERLFGHLSHSWDSILPLPDLCWTKDSMRSYRAELRELISREFASQPLWAWKDPRTSLVVPLWTDVLGELGVEMSYVIVVRNPLDVAASLKRRNGFSTIKSVTLWLLHTLSSFQWTGGTRRAVIHYDLFLSDWKSSLQSLAEALQVPWPESEDHLTTVMKGFLRPDLRHSHSTLESLGTLKDMADPVIDIYSLIEKAVADRSALNSDAFAAAMTKAYKGYVSYVRMLSSLQDWEVLYTAKLERLTQNLEQMERILLSH
jgi:hypothetical protein